MTCAVHWPGSAFAIGPGVQIRQAQPVHLGVHRPAAQRLGTTSRASITLACPNNSGAPIRHGSGNRATSGASTASTAGSIRSATVSVACGRAGRRLTGHPRLAQRRPRSAGPPPRCPRRRPARRNGPSSDQTRNPVRHRTRDALIACELVGRSACPRPPAAPPAAAPAAASASRLRRLGQARVRAGHAPITRPAHGMPCVASASNVSAVWLRVPSPGRRPRRAPARPGRPRGRAASPRRRRARPAARRRPRPASAARAASTSRTTLDQLGAGRQRHARPAARRPPGPAARDSATARRSSVDPGQPADLGEIVVAVGRVPVCTGLHTATSMPASRA